jgi:hypothetical protein
MPKRGRKRVVTIFSNSAGLFAEQVIETGVMR